MYPAFLNGLKHDTFRTRYLVFVYLFVVVVVVVVVCSNNPNLSCHLQVYLLHSLRQKQEAVNACCC